jgi:hypothetical protein
VIGIVFSESLLALRFLFLALVTSSMLLVVQQYGRAQEAADALRGQVHASMTQAVAGMVPALLQGAVPSPVPIQGSLPAGASYTGTVQCLAASTTTCGSATTITSQNLLGADGTPYEIRATMRATLSLVPCAGCAPIPETLYPSYRIIPASPQPIVQEVDDDTARDAGGLSIDTESASCNGSSSSCAGAPNPDPRSLAGAEQCAAQPSGGCAVVRAPVVSATSVTYGSGQ